MVIECVSVCAPVLLIYDDCVEQSKCIVTPFRYFRHLLLQRLIAVRAPTHHHQLHLSIHSHGSPSRIFFLSLLEGAHLFYIFHSSVSIRVNWIPRVKPQIEINPNAATNPLILNWIIFSAQLRLFSLYQREFAKNKSEIENALIRTKSAKEEIECRNNNNNKNTEFW